MRCIDVIQQHGGRGGGIEDRGSYAAAEPLGARPRKLVALRKLQRARFGRSRPVHNIPMDMKTYAYKRTNKWQVLTIGLWCELVPGLVAWMRKWV